MLILSHRDELVHQPAKYFDCSFGVEQGAETSHGEEVVSASVQSLVRRLNKFKPDDFDVLVTDECFPAGTLIDDVPIEEIKEGDYITAFNHSTGYTERRKVLHVFKRIAPQRLVRINGEILCTEHHPIYEVTRGDYKDAIDLRLGDRMLYRVWSRNSMGDSGEVGVLQIPQNRAGILLKGVCKSVFSKNIIRDHESNESEVCLSADEGAQSYEECRNASQDVSDTSSNRTQTPNTGWEWTRNDSSTGFINGEASYAKTSERICSKDTCSQVESRSLSQSLQGRYSDTRRNDSNRGRRTEPYIINQEGTRCEEGCFFEVQRVDSIEILECGDTFGCNSLCPDGYVYNLEVEGLNNYFANGILVRHIAK